MPETIRVTRDGGVSEIVLNRPDKLNSVNELMIREINQALDESGDIRVLLLRGDGRAFCAGRELAEADPANEDATAILRRDYTPC